MEPTTIAVTALTCVAMFQAPRAYLDDAIFINDGVRTRQVFNLEDRPAGGGSAWFFTNAGTAGSVLFSGLNATYGREIWTTNGTTAGTRVLKDINRGAQFWSNPGSSSNPTSVPGGGTAYTTRFQKVGDRIIFPATTFEQGRELWVSDGSALGTRLLRDHMPGSADGVGGRGGPIEFIFSNNSFAIYLTKDVLRGDSLWATDGTPTGTRFLTSFTEFQIPWPIGLLGNRILFVRDIGGTGRGLWITDGTAAGTRLVKDVGTRSEIANISRLEGTSYALMSVYTPTEGQELWITDGTATGTKLLKNINLNNANSNPGSYDRYSEYRGQGAYFKIGDRVVFPATDDPTGRELWVTRGTPGSTFRIADLTPGVQGSDFYQFTVLNDKLYFAAQVLEGGSYAIRPFVTDGTPAGTRKLSASLRVTGRMISLPNTVIFPANNPNGDQYLWKTGPTPNSQTPVSPILNGSLRHLQTVEIPSPNGIPTPCPAESPPDAGSLPVTPW